MLIPFTEMWLKDGIVNSCCLDHLHSNYKSINSSSSGAMYFICYVNSYRLRPTQLPPSQHMGARPGHWRYVRTTKIRAVRTAKNTTAQTEKYLQARLLCPRVCCACWASAAAVASAAVVLCWVPADR